MIANIINHFSVLKDPRIERNKKHELIDIIFLVVSGVLGGAEGWEGLQEFGEEKIDWLQQYVELKNGIPFHDCISRVISRLSFQGFQECFVSWVNAVTEKTEGEIIPIDGKTVRRSHNRAKKKEGNSYGECLG